MTNVIRRAGPAFLAFLMAASVVTLVTPTSPARAGSSICPQSDTDLDNAISAAGAGGTVVLSCPSNQDVAISSTVSLTQNVTLDASSSPGVITLDGRGYVGGNSILAVGKGATVILRSLTVSNGSYSGAIRNAGSLTLDDSSVTDSWTYNDGGAIDNTGSLAVTNSSFSGDSAYAVGSPDEVGGAIYSTGPTLDVINSTFRDNSTVDSPYAPAAAAGGAIDTSSTTTITGSIFLGDTSFSGGAVAAAGPTSISNSTFTGNWANTGSALDDHGAAVTITYSTISGNQSPQAGALSATANGTIDLGADIIGNDDGSNCTAYTTASESGSFSDQGYNLADDTSCGITNGSNGDIVTPAGGIALDAPAANGGQTFTMAIQSGSPAIDGVPVSSGLCPATDQRGFARTNSGAGGCDIGAYEYQDPQTITFGGPASILAFATPATVSAAGVGSGNPVVISVDPKSSAVCSLGSSAGNHASLTTKSTGVCSIDAYQNGGNGFASAHAVKTIAITKSPVQLVYTGPSTIRGGRSATLSARLTSPQGSPVAGKTVALTLHLGHKRRNTCSGVTALSGRVRCTIPKVISIPTARGVYISFAGDADFLGQTALAIVEVTG